MSEIKVNKVSPATGTAITLGDSGDTFTVPSGATIVNSGTATGFGGGKMLQILQTVKTDTATTTSGTFSTVLSVTITPSATSSKVFVLYHFQGYGGNAGSSIKLLRDSTDIYVGDASGSRIQGSGNFKYANNEDIENLSGHYLDSPSSTSAIVYALQWRSNGGTNYMNRSDADANTADATRVPSSITVIEIGA
tara:strand:+ start:756 stop:1334 length:579 start_codon:yes stop_codon:yes gene_type:complete